MISWPHRWFGVWSEYGDAYKLCPSIRQFVLPGISAGYPRDDIERYLRSAPVVASTSRSNFPNPFTQQRLGGSISFRTDGKWVWLDDLADYVASHDVALPPEWVEEMRDRNFVPPEHVDEEAMAGLEWPPESR